METPIKRYVSKLSAFSLLSDYSLMDDDFYSINEKNIKRERNTLRGAANFFTAKGATYYFIWYTFDMQKDEFYNKIRLQKKYFISQLKQKENDIPSNRLIEGIEVS